MLLSKLSLHNNMRGYAYLLVSAQTILIGLQQLSGLMCL